jgi:hypothetical protein
MAIARDMAVAGVTLLLAALCYVGTLTDLASLAG